MLKVRETVLKILTPPLGPRPVLVEFDPDLKQTFTPLYVMMGWLEGVDEEHVTLYQHQEVDGVGESHFGGLRKIPVRSIINISRLKTENSC